MALGGLLILFSDCSKESEKQRLIRSNVGLVLAL